MTEELWPEAPKPPEKSPVHRLAWAVGYCPECNGIRARNPEKVDLVELLRYIREEISKRGKFECADCHNPLPISSREEAERLDKCPWCGGTKAHPRK